MNAPTAVQATREGAARPNPDSSPAVLAIWNDIDPEIAGEYDLWYQQDHLRDRVGTPGFRSCRRYVRVQGEGREYFTFSDLDSIEASRSPQYRERLANPTEWTRRVMPHFRRLVRTAAHVTVDLGDGTGGVVATAIFEGADTDRREALRAAVVQAADAVMTGRCVTRIRVFEDEAAATGVPNPEASLRPEPPRRIDVAVVLEGTSEAQMMEALTTIIADPQFQGLERVTPPAVYRLLFSSRN